MRTRPLEAALAPLLALVLGSCGGDQGALEVKNVTAVGSVGGLLLDAVSRTPVVGAEVVLVAGGAPVTSASDASGAFGFAEVPAGEVALAVSASGYLSAVLHGTLVGEAGEFPVDNGNLTFGPMGLVPDSGSLTLLVVYDDGSPAADIDMTARSNRRFYDYSATAEGSGFIDAQATVVAGTTDATGQVTFTGLPDFLLMGTGFPGEDAITVVVPPVPAPNGSSSLYRYPGGSFVYNMTALGSSTPVVVLAQPTPGSLAVLASNVPALEGPASGTVPAVLGASGPIWATFNQPLDANATRAWILDEAGVTFDAQMSQAISFGTIQLSFAEALEAGREYNLVIHAVAAVGNRILQGDFSAPFFTTPGEHVQKPTVARDPVNPSLLKLTFSEPIGTGNPAYNSLDQANCVAFYAYDIDGSKTTGDCAGEVGNQSCLSGYPFAALEPDPPGIAGPSGYTRYWSLHMPMVNPLAPMPMPANVMLNLVFSRVSNPSFVLKRVTGVPVTDFTETNAIGVP